MLPPIQAAGRAHVDVVLEKRQVQRAYELYAPIYDFIFDWIFAPGREAAIGHLGLTRHHSLLEVGIGTGLNLPLYPATCRLTGIDLSQEMLDKAVERVQTLAMPDVTLKVMDATSMDFGDDEFDRAAEESWTREPFDRLIVAHARLRGWRLATADAAILERLRPSERFEL